MRLIILVLYLATAFRFADGAAHGIGDRIGIHDDAAFGIARRAADGLHQGRFAAQKTLLIGVENGNQPHFGQIQSLAEQVNAAKHVEFSAS